MEAGCERRVRDGVHIGVGVRGGVDGSHGEFDGVVAVGQGGLDLEGVDE